MEGWTELQNADLHNLYSVKYNYRDLVKEDEIGGSCSMNGENRRARKREANNEAMMQVGG
jgi:hypothetical protein